MVDYILSHFSFLNMMKILWVSVHGKDIGYSTKMVFIEHPVYVRSLAGHRGYSCGILTQIPAFMGLTL